MEYASASTHDQATESDLLFTAAAYDAHRRELESLIEMRDQDLPRLLNLVAMFGTDPAEQRAELQEDLADLKEWIRELDAILKDATVIADTAAPVVVAIGREADVEHLGSGRVVTHRVTGGLWAGPGSISAASPVGSALIGRAAGDVVAVDRPAGHAEHLRVLAVRPGAAPEDLRTADAQLLSIEAVDRGWDQERGANQGDQP